MKSRITFLLLFATLIFSCRKDQFNLDSAEYFIFGVSYCKCGGGQCAQLYKYTPAALVKGEGEWCLPENYTYKGPALSVEDLALAEALLNDFPEALYDSEITTFGCPDCADQGGYYAEIKKDGVVKSWRLDTDADAIPAFLVPFQQHIKETVDVLQ